MNTTIFNEILAFLFGRKYWLNVIQTRGTTNQEFTSFIFTSKKAAHEHRDMLKNESTTFRYIETLSVRSRNINLQYALKNVSYNHKKK